MQTGLKYQNSLDDTLNICLRKDLSFAAYRLPAKTNVTIVAQKNNKLQSIDDFSAFLPEKGFLVAPFSRNENKAYLIKPDLVFRSETGNLNPETLEVLPDKLPAYHVHSCCSDTGREDYIRLVDESVFRIKSGEFEKVVLSRVKTVTGNFVLHLSEIFRLLCHTNPNAFVYLLSMNEQIWIGATPEPFICSCDDELFTVSLAGTRPYNNDSLGLEKWNKKELLEQEYVTRHIERILHSFNLKSLTRKGPYVARAGNLLHLRTDFSFSKKETGPHLAPLINALHPTPAVCGMSTGKAMEFIRKVETHNREYYTGFLGPVGIDDYLQLYVNLRCLKVYDDCVALYIGGGITIDSNSEEEWQETDIKAETLLSVLRQIQ